MLEELKHEVWEANLALHRSGLVLLTWGNVSGLDADAGVFAIKPSGVSYAELRPEQMVLVDLDGRVVEGTLRPSSDTPTHRVLYRELKGLRGVAHTHSTYATAWAQACRGLPCYGTTHADTFRGTVPVTAPLDDRALAGDYEWETGRANHGPFTWGGSAAQAVENSIVLEQVALLALLTEGLAPGLGPIRAPLLDKHFLRKHGASAYYGQQPTMQ
jgi:L-ribulose-5-phosphate 4-epimerase